MQARGTSRGGARTWSARHRTGWDQSLSHLPRPARGAGAPPGHGLLLFEVRARWREQSEATHEKLLFMTISSLTQHPPQVEAQPPRGASRLALSAWPELRARGPPALATTPGPSLHPRLSSIPARAPTTTRSLPFRSPPQRRALPGELAARGGQRFAAGPKGQAGREGRTAGAQRPALPGIPAAPAPAPPRSPSPSPVSAGTCRAPDVSAGRGPAHPGRRAP